MRALTGFEKGKILGARIAGASDTKTDEPYQRPKRNSRSTGKPPAIGVIPAKLTDRDQRALKRIVERKHRTTAAKVTAELNQHLNSPVSTKTVRCELNEA